MFSFEKVVVFFYVEIEAAASDKRMMRSCMSIAIINEEKKIKEWSKSEEIKRTVNRNQYTNDPMDGTKSQAQHT